MNKKIKLLNKNTLKQVNGGWGPLKSPNNPNSPHNQTFSIIPQWEFSNEEAQILRKYGFMLKKGNLGYTVIDKEGLLFYYDDQSDRQRIEEILGKEK